MPQQTIVPRHFLVHKESDAVVVADWELLCQEFWVEFTRECFLDVFEFFLVSSHFGNILNLQLALRVVFFYICFVFVEELVDILQQLKTLYTVYSSRTIRMNPKNTWPIITR